MERNVYGLPLRGKSSKPIEILNDPEGHLGKRLRLRCPECGRDSDHLEWKTGNSSVPVACPLCHKAPGVFTVKPKVERVLKALFVGATGLGIGKVLHLGISWLFGG